MSTPRLHVLTTISLDMHGRQTVKSAVFFTFFRSLGKLLTNVLFDKNFSGYEPQSLILTTYQLMSGSKSWGLKTGGKSFTGAIIPKMHKRRSTTHCFIVNEQRDIEILWSDTNQTVSVHDDRWHSFDDTFRHILKPQQNLGFPQRYLRYRPQRMMKVLSLFSCSFLFLSCIFSFAFYIPSCTHSVLVSWQISLPRFQLFVLSFYIPSHISFAFLVFHCFCWIYLDVAIMLVNSWMRSNERVIGGTWCGGKNVVNIRSPIQVLTPPDRA